MSVTLQLGIGLAIALLLDAAKRRRAPGTALARVAVVSAWVMPGVLVGVLWRILLMENRAGIANYALSFAGIGPLSFLRCPLALASLIVAQRMARVRVQHDPAIRRALSGYRASCTKRPTSRAVSAWQRLRWWSCRRSRR